MLQVTERHLTRLPKFSHLIAGILCKKNSDVQPAYDLPATCFWVKNVKPDSHRVTAFNHTVNWQQGSILHPGYLHTLAFPLQLKLMLEHQFPFAIIGLVHIRNNIEQQNPVYINDELDIACQFGEIVKLNIGSLFTIDTTFYVKHKCVLKAQHQYLKRENSDLKTPPQQQTKEPWSTPYPDEVWSLKSALGRQYAACSGDYNPIHLHGLSARLFGFKQHIIHGMWLKSRVISALCQEQQGILNSSFSCEVEFKKPLYLPNTVCFQQQVAEPNLKKQVIGFKVVSELNNLPVEHMAGRLVR